MTFFGLNECKDLKIAVAPSVVPPPNGIKACVYYFSSLRHRHNLTFCVTAVKQGRHPCCWAPNGFNKLLEVCFEFLSCYGLNELLEVEVDFEFLSC